jgi:hypothetical protein
MEWGGTAEGELTGISELGWPVSRSGRAGGREEG